jgi:hypothetical protein
MPNAVQLAASVPAQQTTPPFCLRQYLKLGAPFSSSASSAPDLPALGPRPHLVGARLQVLLCARLMSAA